MQLSDFDYDLPTELIAQLPLERRTDSRLLHLDGASGALRDLQFRDLPSLLASGDLLVFNDTRVIPARMFGRKPTGGRVELLIERIEQPYQALAHIRASKSPKPGSEILVGDNWRIRVLGRQGDLFVIGLAQGDLYALMEEQGHVPLPPYITRSDALLDRERYQTVYAERPGAVAAPTAGLHFDRPLLEQLARQGVASARVTLHVGAGTFQPVRDEDLDKHRMHREHVEVGSEVCELVRQTRAAGGRVVAVGTTSVRSLEAAAGDGELRPFRGDTRLFIRPGYRFTAVDALITNFHLPKSTLLMLVAAFSGYDNVMCAYRHAVQQRYRFFSYGDAMFLTRWDGLG